MDKDNNNEIIIERWISPSTTVHDQSPNVTLKIEERLRPAKFSEYPGQKHAKSNLEVYVKAAKNRKQPLDHVLLHGPPGLGKTTLANILANELEVPFHLTSGPAIEKPGDLAGILAGIEPGALLFIDEIHRLSIAVEEVLYTAMEDFSIDVVVGQGPTARTVRMPLQPFTLVGATTRIASMSSPFLSRFGIQERLDFYDDDALVTILQRSARILDIELSNTGAALLAQRSRGTPRVANRLLKRVRDFAEFENHFTGKPTINEDLVDLALNKLDIDHLGLDRMDRAILDAIEDRYNGGPVGIETLAATLGEDKNTLEEVYEPFLVYKGLVCRGPRGRSLTDKGRRHLENTQKT
jgi:Holliday junction DNA helicase RuvB